MVCKDSGQNKTFTSPLALYQHRFCCACSDGEWCKPNELRMLICVLCAFLDTTLLNNKEKTTKNVDTVTTYPPYKPYKSNSNNKQPTKTHVPSS